MLSPQGGRRALPRPEPPGSNGGAAGLDDAGKDDAKPAGPVAGAVAGSAATSPPPVGTAGGAAGEVQQPVILEWKGMSAAIVPFSAASVGDWLVEAAHSREAKHRGESANASEEARRLLAPLSFDLELLLLLGHPPFSKPVARAGQAHLLPRVSASLQSPAISLTLREDDVPDIVSICGQFAQHMTPPSPEALAVRRGPLHIAEVRSLLGWSDETEFGDCDCFVANGSFYFDAAVGQQCVPLSGVALLQRSAQSLELRWADGGRRPESKHAQHGAQRGSTDAAVSDQWQPSEGALGLVTSYHHSLVLSAASREEAVRWLSALASMQPLQLPQPPPPRRVISSCGTNCGDPDSSPTPPSANLKLPYLGMVPCVIRR